MGTLTNNVDLDVRSGSPPVAKNKTIFNTERQYNFEIYFKIYIMDQPNFIR